jgi:hypothetical protein
MVFINAVDDANLDCPALGAFRDMASVGSSPALQIVVQMGRQNFSNQMCDPKWTDAPGGVRRFHIERQTPPFEPTAENGELLPYPDHPQDNRDDDANMGRGKSVANFVKWAKEKYPASHYALIIKGHGQGVNGPFLHITDFTKNEKMSPDSNKDVPSGIFTPFYDTVFQQKLFSRDLADALATSLGPDKLDILAFDSCVMSGIENAYAFRKVAAYLVASERSTWDTAWKYKKFLMPLASGNGTVSVGDLARSMVETYQREKPEGGYFQYTLAAVDLARVDEFANRFSLLSEALDRDVDEERLVDSVWNANAGLQSVGSDVDHFNLIDLGGLLHLLGDSSALEPRVRQEARSLASEIDASRLIIARTPAVHATDGHGLSIYFPAAPCLLNADRYDTDPRSGNAYVDTKTCEAPDPYHARIAFVCEKEWSAFVLDYLKNDHYGPPHGRGTCEKARDADENKSINRAQPR